MTNASLLYIHGYGSSPDALKAQLLREYLERHGAADHLRVPALPVEPRRAMAVLEEEMAAGPAGLVGSSLGGFYATWLAAHHDVPAVLVNPVVQPWRLFDAAAAEAEGFRREWTAQLQQYAVDMPTAPERLLVLLQTGDDTLDWRDAWEYYGDCHLYRGLGGSHGFDDFDAFIPLIFRFCGIDPRPDAVPGG